MQCADCGEEAEDLEIRRAKGKTVKLCEDCAAARDEESEVAGEAEHAMQGMMEYKGKR